MSGPATLAPPLIQERAQWSRRLNAPESESRRRLLKQLALAASVSTLASTQLRAADLPLIDVNDPVAKAVKYVEDTKTVKESEGNRCDTCSLYGGKDGTTQGPCLIFKGKAVKAAGWCSSWAPQE
jgi:hypothetical protein